MKSRSIVLYNPFGWRASKGAQYRGRRRARAVHRVLCQLVTLWLSLSLSTSDCASTSEGLPGLERLRGRTADQRKASLNAYNAAASGVESLSEKVFKDQRHVYEVAEQTGNADEFSDETSPSPESMRVSKDERAKAAEDKRVPPMIPLRKPSRDAALNFVESQLNPLQSSPPHRNQPVVLHPPHPAKKKASRYAYAPPPPAVKLDLVSLQTKNLPLPPDYLQEHEKQRFRGHGASRASERMRVNHTPSMELPVIRLTGVEPVRPGGVAAGHIIHQVHAMPQVYRTLPPLRGQKTLLAAGLLYMMGWLSLSTTLFATALGTFRLLKSREERQEALGRPVGS